MIALGLLELAAVVALVMGAVWLVARAEDARARRRREREYQRRAGVEPSRAWPRL